MEALTCFIHALNSGGCYLKYWLIHSSFTNGPDNQRTSNHDLFQIETTYLHKFIRKFRFLPATPRFALCFGRNDRFLLSGSRGADSGRSAPAICPPPAK